MTSAFTVTASRGRHAARPDAKKGNGDGGEVGGGPGAGVATEEAGGGGLDAGPGPGPAADGRSRRWGRWWWVGGLVVVAGLAYVPLLLVRPGVSPPTRRHTCISTRSRS